MTTILRISAAFLATIVLPGALCGAASDAADLQSLRAQVQALEQQLKALARQIELREEAAAAAAPAAPKITITDKGYTLASGDGANSIQLRALLQLDSRVFLNDGGGIVNDTFTLRRARLITEGALARRYGYQFVTEFGGSSVSILDANFTVNVSRELTLKVGKFKTPVGLEVLQSDSATSFSERSMLAGMLPNRDLGIQLGGALGDGRVSYAVGIFNGVADGANSTNSDFDEEKDVAARIVATPFKPDAHSSLRGLALGIGISDGHQKSAAGRTAGYRTDGQQTFFAYNPAVIADGHIRRFSPQVDYRHGPLGFMGEYVITTANLRPAATSPKSELRHKGWQLTAGYVLTGEDSTYGQVTPQSDFNPTAGTWGAFEVFGRFAEVMLDDATFPAFASPATSATDARASAVGLNWYLSKAVVFKFDYYHTEFRSSPLARGTSLAPVIRQDENAIVTRFQLAF